MAALPPLQLGTLPSPAEQQGYASCVRTGAVNVNNKQRETLAFVGLSKCRWLPDSPLVQGEREEAYLTGDQAYYLLQECAKRPSLDHCRHVQCLLAHSGLHSISFLADHLIRLFASCGSLADATQAFCGVAVPSAYTWSAVISAHAHLGQGAMVIDLYDRMLVSGVRGDKFVYLALLNGCTAMSDLSQGKFVHKQIIESRFRSDIQLGNALIDMYAKCGNLEEASSCFNEMSNRDVVSWGTMITGCIHHGKCGLALEYFERMQQEGIKPDKVAFVSALKACWGMGDLTRGVAIHEQIMNSGFQNDPVIGNTLIDMYAKCGSLEKACIVFDNLQHRDVVSWNVMISAYTQHHQALLALDCFKNMQQQGIRPTIVTFVSIVKACGSLGAITQGKYIHEQIRKSGLCLDVTLGNALVDMYAKCGNLEEARALFDTMIHHDVVSWGSLISGYAQQGESLLALECFDKMQQEKFKPDVITFVSILKACSSLQDLAQGKLIHEQIMRSGFSTNIILENTLVDMYAKCGSLEKARAIFDELHNRNVVSWNAMITGYAHHGEGSLALDCFQKMQQECVKPDNVTYLSVLKACGSIGAIAQGKAIHEQILQSGLQLDDIMGNALVDMYARGGSMQEASTVFGALPKRDVASWGAMIAGYAQCGNLKLAVKCFEDMQLEGIKPDDMTFTSLLAACTRAGQVREGQKYFKSMKEDHGIVPNVVHNNCMGDLLARAGHLDEAQESIQPDIVALTSLLSACRSYGNVELGRKCFNQATQLDPQNGSLYMLMSGIYSDAGMLDHAAEIEDLRQLAGAWKKPAKAWIEVEEKVHEFIVGDQTHPQGGEIRSILRRLNDQIKEAGYGVNGDLLPQDSYDEKKESALCGHAERQAIAFGILSTPVGMSIRVSKNLRMCNDCHSTIKAISKIENREIVIKDAYCIHRMEDGVCSCST